MPYEDEETPYADAKEPPEDLDRLARAVIGAAIEVHRELGPGLPEQAYQAAMELELKARNIPFQRQVVVTINYKGVQVAKGCIDLVVGGQLVVELKSVDVIALVHRMQARRYMRIIHQPLGLVINFNVALLKEGIRRVIDT